MRATRQATTVNSEGRPVPRSMKRGRTRNVDRRGKCDHAGDRNERTAADQRRVIDDERHKWIAAGSTAASALRIRLAVLERLVAEGKEWENSEGWLKPWTEALNTFSTEMETIEQSAIARVLEAFGVTGTGRKAEYARRRRKKRAERIANGDCVACPSKEIKPARPDRTTCAECGEADVKKNQRLRARKPKEKGAKRRAGRQGNA